MSTPPQPAPQKPAQGSGRFLIGMIGLLLGVLLLGAGATLWLGGLTSSAPVIGGPFSLTAPDGAKVTDRDLRGSYVLVYFGYTFCPDICPTTLNQVAEALDMLGPQADRIRPVFITIDPRRDTPKVMGAYIAAFTPRLLGLTGTEAEIAAVAKEFRVYYAPHKTGDGPGDYTMDHSSVLYLLGPDGRFIAPLRADQTARQIADTLSKAIK